MIKLRQIHNWKNKSGSFEPDYFSLNDLNFNIPFSFEEYGDLRQDLSYIGLKSEDKLKSLYLDFDNYLGFILRVEGLNLFSNYNDQKYQKPENFLSGMPSFSLDIQEKDVISINEKPTQYLNSRIDFILNPSIEIYVDAVIYKFGCIQTNFTVISYFLIY
jgi:hypothetical protein